MVDTVKFAIYELNGEEFETPSEYDAKAENIYYDASKQKTVKEKLDSFAKGYEDFFQNVLDQDLTIPAGRSKIVSNFIDSTDKIITVDGILEIT